MKVTVKFANTDGETFIATFDLETGAVQDQTGRKGTFKSAPGSKTVEITGEQNLTIKGQDSIQFTPGFSTQYASSNGKTGTVTVLSVE